MRVIKLMQKILFTILLFGSTIVCHAQQTDSTAIGENEEVTFFKPDNSDPLKFGLKLGIGYSGLSGTELHNAIGRIGINGSAYLRYRFNPKFSIQAEFGASFRGSNFNNNPAEYSSIRLYYLDMPLMLSYAFDKTKNDFVVVGLQYSYLVSSAFYISTNALPEPTSPSFNKNDCSAILGFQFNTPFVGFQVLGKYGLLNLNQNQPWPSAAQPANNEGYINNFSLEFNLLF